VRVDEVDCVLLVWHRYKRTYDVDDVELEAIDSSVRSVRDGSGSIAIERA
jgi:hypothetical protein